MWYYDLPAACWQRQRTVWARDDRPRLVGHHRFRPLGVEALMNKRQEAENWSALAVAATMVMDELKYDNHRPEVAAAITLLTEYRAQGCLP
jgi:hypothetical protein